MRRSARSTATPWRPSSNATCAGAAPDLAANPVCADWLKPLQSLVIGAGGTTQRGYFGVQLRHQLGGSFTDRQFADRGGQHHQLGALVAQPACYLSPDSASSTGDEDDFALH